MKTENENETPAADITATIEGFEEQAPTTPATAPAGETFKAGEWVTFKGDEWKDSALVLRVYNHMGVEFLDVQWWKDGTNSSHPAEKFTHASAPKRGQAFRVSQRVRIADPARWLESIPDRPDQPTWGGESGHVGGTVQAVTGAGTIDEAYHVKWDNGSDGILLAWKLQALTTAEQLMAADNEPLRQAERERERAKREAERAEPREPWPAEATRNREAWLTHAARCIATHPDEDLRGVLLSVGFGKGGTRGSKEWSVIDNAKGDGWQVFVRPTVDNKTKAADCVRSALQSLGVRVRALNVGEWPAYPQPDVEHEHKAQATRLLKVYCKACGYTVRATKRWTDTGLPLCPCQNPPLPMVLA